MELNFGKCHLCDWHGQMHKTNLWDLNPTKWQSDFDMRLWHYRLYSYM